MSVFESSSNDWQFLLTESGKGIFNEFVITANEVKRIVETIGEIFVACLSTAYEEVLVVSTRFVLNARIQRMTMGSRIVVAHSLQKRRRVVHNNGNKCVIIGSQFAFSSLVQGFGCFFGFIVISVLSFISFSLKTRPSLLQYRLQDNQRHLWKSLKGAAPSHCQRICAGKSTLTPPRCSGRMQAELWSSASKSSKISATIKDGISC